MLKLQWMFASLMALGLVVSSSSFAENRLNITNTLNQFYSVNPANKSLADEASGMLVFPSITKGGIGVGGEYGVGALEVNGKTVGYYKITGGSIGATLGVEKNSEVILFMAQSTLDNFTQSKGWTVGVDANIAIVKGVGGQYDTETLKKPVLGFVFDERGGMIDISLDGSKITKIEQ